jgi:aminopeptidase N
MLSDSKGHWVYHMLRRRIGDELFFACLRELLAEFAHRDLRLQDLRAHFVRRAPAEAELETFFAQWLDRKGAPVLACEWRRLDAGRIEITLLQRQKAEPYHLELDLEIQFAEELRAESVTLRRRKTRFVVSASSDPVALRLDPDHELLIWDPLYGDEAPL